MKFKKWNDKPYTMKIDQKLNFYFSKFFRIWDYAKYVAASAMHQNAVPNIDS